MIGECLFVDFFQRDHPYQRAVFGGATTSPHLQDAIYFHHMVSIVAHFTPKQCEIWGLAEHPIDRKEIT